MALGLNEAEREVLLGFLRALLEAVEPVEESGGADLDAEAAGDSSWIRPSLDARGAPVELVGRDA